MRGKQISPTIVEKLYHLGEIKEKFLTFFTIMDPRFRSFSFEMIIVVAVFLTVFQSGILSMDVTNPITLTVLFLFVIECFRILYKLRRFRKEGVNIAEQSYRSPIVDTISPRIGSSYTQINKWIIRLIGLILIVSSILWFLK